MKKLIAVILGLAIATFLFGGPELRHHVRAAINRPVSAACRAIDVPPHHREQRFHHPETPRPHHHEARHGCRLI